MTNPATPTNNGWIGNGVTVADVTRNYSDFLDAQTRRREQQLQPVQYRPPGLANSINNMFANSSTGLSATLQSFSQAIQTMANSPAQSSTRQAVLSQAQSVISQFQAYQNNLSQLGGQVNTQIQSEASTITSLAQNIAGLNKQIMAAQNNGTGQPPNSLLDQRNNLIDQLSQNLSVNTVAQSDGSLSVFIGSGQALVVGGLATTLSATPDQFSSGQLDLSLKTSAGTVDITNQLSGGSLGGLLQFRSQMLFRARMPWDRRP